MNSVQEKVDFRNIEEAIQQQRDYFKTGTTLDIDGRKKHLRALSKAMKNHEQDFYEAMHKDFHKSEFETYLTELSFVYKEIDKTVKNIGKWAKPRKVSTNLPNLPSKSYRYPSPMGNTLIISPWNYPISLSVIPVVSAIAAGNTAILKPSELTPETSRVLQQVFEESIPQELVNVIQGAVPETTALLKNKFDLIFFTGSTNVGRIVYKAAAEHLTPVILELGGKSPAIIDESADIDNAAKRLAWSKFLNSGQTCIAPDYVYVPENKQEELVQKLKKYINEFDYSLENGNMTKIIGSRHFDRLASMIDQDKVAIGGKADGENLYIEPTVMTNVSWDDKVMEDEIFGPILPIITYKNLDNIVSDINNRPKPLAAYFYTKSKKIKDKLVKMLAFGGSVINDGLIHFTNDNLPFGGVGESGTGGYHGKYGFDSFSHLKSVMDKPVGLEPNFRYPPYTDGKLSMLKRIFSF